MAFEQGIATSQEDFADKFRLFAQNSGGWTVDEFNITDDRMSLHKGGIYFHWGWDNNSDIEVHQSLNWTAIGDPDSHENDSGNGASGSTGRSINDIGNGPFTSHFFFQGTSPTEHLYAVLEYAPGQYRHFGACDIEKEGDWTGGETVVTCLWTPSSASDQINNLHCVMMDAGCNSASRAGTMHVEGLPDGPASHRWGVFARSNTPATDGDGNTRVNIVGGVRGGPYTEILGSFPTSLTQGFVPLIDIPAWYNYTGATPDQLRLLGYYPNIRTINMSAFQPQDELPVGGDTWKIFPFVRRQAVGGTEEQSGFGGLAYKKT